MLQATEFNKVVAIPLYVMGSNTAHHRNDENRTPRGRRWGAYILDAVKRQPTRKSLQKVGRNDFSGAFL